MNDKWFSANGYEPYQVNRNGEIRSIDRVIDCKDGDKSHRKGIILKPYVTPFGYYRVRISLFGKLKHAFVHRMVAETFIYNPDKKRCVNHKNGIKTDNRVENLEWVSHKENTLHAYKIKLMNGRYGVNNTSSRLVLNTQTGIFYDCINEAANVHGIPVKRLYKWLDGTNANRSNLIYA